MAAPGKKLASHKPASAPAYARRFPRFAIDARMQVRMFQAGEFRNCWGRSTELGQDGIGATLTGDLEIGERRFRIDALYPRMRHWTEQQFAKQHAFLAKFFGV